MGRDVMESDITFTGEGGKKYAAEFDDRWYGTEKCLEEWDVDTDVYTTTNLGDYRIDFELVVSIDDIKFGCNDGCLFLMDDEILNFCKNKRFAFYCSTVVDIHSFKYFSYCLDKKKARIVKSFLPAIECPEHIGEANYVDPAACLGPIPHLHNLIMDNIRSFLIPDTDDPLYINWDMMHDSISDPNVWYNYDDYDDAGKYNYICCPKFLAVDIDICRKHFDKYDGEEKDYLYSDDIYHEEKRNIYVKGYVVHD